MTGPAYLAPVNQTEGNQGESTFFARSRFLICGVVDLSGCANICAVIICGVVDLLLGRLFLEG